MKKGITGIMALAALLCTSTALKAQKTDTTKSGSSAESLLNSMDKDDKAEPVIATFKSTRLILSQTSELVKKKNLNFQIIHRFGDIGGPNHGAQTAFGLDQVNDVFINFEYGVSDNFNIDLGRSTIGQLIQLEAKYAVLHQTSDNSVPVAVSVLGEFGQHPYGSFDSYSARLSYLAQAVIARKFSSAFSFQVSPTFVRNNTPNPEGSEKQFFAMQAAARVAISKHSGFILDYSHTFSSFRNNSPLFADPLAFGYEVETGGHVFTLNISNSRSISEINSLSNPDADYGRGAFRFGFTISRMFDFNHGHKKYTEK